MKTFKSFEKKVVPIHAKINGHEIAKKCIFYMPLKYNDDQNNYIAIKK